MSVIHKTLLCQDVYSHLHSVAKGALVRHGDFYYPARLLQLEQPDSRLSGVAARMWRVQYWRMCIWPPETGPPDPSVPVPESRIVDELWQEKHERRKIRVGDQYSFE